MPSHVAILLAGRLSFRRPHWNAIYNDRDRKWHLLRHRLVSRLLILLVALGLLALPVLMAAAPEVFTNDKGTACKPDGTFSLSFDSKVPGIATPSSPWTSNLVIFRSPRLNFSMYAGTWELAEELKSSLPCLHISSSPHLLLASWRQLLFPTTPSKLSLYKTTPSMASYRSCAVFLATKPIVPEVV